MTKRNYNSSIIEILGAKPIAFNPVLGKVAQSATAGLFLSQLLYWWGKGHSNGWIYKTINEFYEETILTRSEQDRAIRIWKDLEIIDVQNKGIPRRRHFRINVSKLADLLHINSDVITISAKQSAEFSRLYRPNLRTITERKQRNTQKEVISPPFDKRMKEVINHRRDLVQKLSMNKK